MEINWKRVDKVPEPMYRGKSPEYERAYEKLKTMEVGDVFEIEMPEAEDNSAIYGISGIVKRAGQSLSPKVFKLNKRLTSIYVIREE